MGRPHRTELDEESIRLEGDSPNDHEVIEIGRSEAERELRELQDFSLERGIGGRLQILQVGLTHKR